MPVSQTHHPDLDKLSAFGLGLLSEADSAEIESHLINCAACCEKLEYLPADSLVDLLQASEADTPSDLSVSIHTVNLRSPASAPSSLPPLYKKLANIVTGKPTGEPVQPSPAKVAAFYSRKIPSELTEHSRYEVLEHLGAGGMGAVYKAKHRLMDRVVAIKIVNPLLVTKPGAVDRFIREVKAAAQLTHPNIVTAYDAEAIGEMHVLVMEYVEGETLAELLQEQGVLGVDPACDYIRQAALGLQHAVDRGMVHRDIKPLNLMLTRQQSVKILDFGLARFVSEQTLVDGTTEHGSMMGSPDYMAPEQARDAHSADARADIYSLGCTLYQLLAGQVPFPGLPLLEKLEAHRDQQPPALNELRLDVPAELERIIAKMMAKDLDERYQTPAEVAEALLPFTQARPTPRHVEVKPLKATLDQKPIYAMAVVVALLLAAIGYWAAQVVFRVETPQGTLIVTADDPDVQISVKSSGKEVALFFPQQKKEVQLAIGAYTLELVGGKEGLTLSANKFEIRSGSDEKTVTVEFVPTVAKSTPKKPSAPSKPPTELGFPYSAEEGQEKQREWAKYLNREVVETNSVGMKLALIPPGEFPMTPEYRVRLTNPYYLGVHQVTVGQFGQFVKETGYRTDSETNGGGFVYDEKVFIEQKAEYVWGNRDFSPTDDHPVVFVSWTDAVRFCAWLSLKEEKNYRLPTVAEWEWASRGGAMLDAETMQSRGWFAANSGKRSQPVGKLPADVFGLFDMFGNVHEHCQDWKGPLPTGLFVDPDGPPEGQRRLQRGGSFLHSPEEYSDPASDWRDHFPNSGSNGGGLRVVCDIAAPEATLVDSSLPAIPSVEELLKTREVLTVAQDGSGGYKTIGEALDNVKAGQVVQVMDKGPYREFIGKGLPADVALVSLVSTRIEIPKYNSYAESSEKGKFHYYGASLHVQSNFRLSGFEWVGAAPRPENLLGGSLLFLGAAGDMVVERCSFRAPDYLTAGVFGITRSEQPARLLVQDNFANQPLEFREIPGSLIVQRNWISSSGWAMIFNPRADSVLIRHNVVNANYAISFYSIVADKTLAGPGVALKIHNNVLDAAHCPIVFWNGPKETCVLPRSAFIANNIIRSEISEGVLMIPEDMALVKARFEIGPNVYQAAPKKTAGSSFDSWPISSRDLILAKQFLSDELNNTDYLRIAADGPLATDGAGGDLPTYFGAFPPGPAPEEGDWFTRMQEVKEFRDAHPIASDLVFQARRALETKDFEKAISLGGDALRMEPEDAGALSVRSQALIRQGKMREALPDVEHVLRIEPQDAAANINLAWILLNTGQLDASIAHCTRALEKGFQGAEAAAIFNNRAGAWCFKGRFEKGLADFEAGIKADPNSWINQAGKSTVLARMGDPARAKLALDEAIRLNPQVETEPPKFFLDDIIPQPIPLAEWREGREFLTVAQKGPADHRTIQDALNALKPGQYVKVLDKGPYRETIIHHRGIADIALVSEVGTRIEVPHWYKWGPSPNDKEKSIYQGFFLSSTDGLRLSGFEFRLPPVPTGADYVAALEIAGAGDLIIESCQVRYHRDVVSALPEEEKQRFASFVGLTFGWIGQWTINSGRFLVQDNLIDGKVELRADGRVQATVQRNWFRGGEAVTGLELPFHAETECAIRHNIIQSYNGIALRARGSEQTAATAGRYLVANNFVDVHFCPFWAFSAVQEPEARQALSRAVTIQNNILRSQSRSGLQLHADDLKVMTDVWKIGHNCFGAEPAQFAPDRLPVFPKQPTDLIVAGPFLSDDPQQADYPRIPTDSRLATGGVGGNLPSYIGPLPPGPAPQDGDWFTRLKEVGAGK